MATAAATAAAVARRGLRLSGIAPRRLGDLSVTPFGIGGYRLEPGNEDHVQAVVSALKNGVTNLLETSSHYASESLLGAVLAEAADRGVVAREEVVLVTKVGHAASDPSAARPSFPSMSLPGQPFYSLHPDFIADEVAASTARLGTVPDAVLLHNPDFLLAAAMRQGVPRAEAHERFHECTRAAFERLECLVGDGRIGDHYGVSANVMGCRWSVSGEGNAYEGPSFSRLLADAESAAGGGVGGGDGSSHRLRTLQIPLNLLELGGAMGHVDPAAPLPAEGEETELAPSALRLARQHGVGVLANRALNAIPPAELPTGDWSKDGGGLQHAAADYFKLRDTSPQVPVLAILKNCVLESGGGQGGAEPEPGPEASVQQLALWVAASTAGVDAVLSGARSLEHVRDLAAASAWGRAEEQRVWDTFDRVQDACDELMPAARKRRR